MAIVTKDPSSLRMRFDYGVHPETDKSIVKSRTYSNVKPQATNDEVHQVGMALASLHSKYVLEIAKIDKSVLSA